MSEAYVNLWLTSMGLEASAHPSMDDALDDISSPAEGATYRGTLTEKDGKWVEMDLSAQASIYAARCTAEWLYWLSRGNAFGDRVA